MDDPLSHLSLFSRGSTKSRSLSLLNILVLILIFKALSHLSLFSRGSTKSRSQITSSGGLPAALLSKNRSLIIDTHIGDVDTEAHIQNIATQAKRHQGLTHFLFTRYLTCTSETLTQGHKSKTYFVLSWLDQCLSSFQDCHSHHN